LLFWSSELSELLFFLGRFGLELRLVGALSICGATFFFSFVFFFLLILSSSYSVPPHWGFSFVVF